MKMPWQQEYITQQIVVPAGTLLIMNTECHAHLKHGVSLSAFRLSGTNVSMTQCHVLKENEPVLLMTDIYATLSVRKLSNADENIKLWPLDSKHGKHKIDCNFHGSVLVTSNNVRVENISAQSVVMHMKPL